MALIKLNTRSIPDAEIGTVNIADDAVTPVKIASELQPFNRIINGAMTIDQRNAGASVAFTSAAYCLDRWVGAVGTASGTTIQRSTTATTGFSNSALITIGTGAAPSSGAVNRIYQVIEGYNIADLSWGTASAATVTLSFWVRSSVIGTFSGALYGASTIQSYPFNYTISVANTFEKKTVTITGPTTGTWDNTNGTGLYLNFDLGSGTSFKTSAGSWSTGTFIGATSSVNLCATSGATFYITGVQLETGSTASPFAHENVGDTLQKCQRYYNKWTAGSSYTAWAFGYAKSTTNFVAGIQFPTMRTSPTITASNTGINNGPQHPVTTNNTFHIGPSTAWVDFNIGSASLVAGQGGLWNAQNNTAAYVDFTAEL